MRPSCLEIRPANSFRTHHPSEILKSVMFPVPVTVTMAAAARAERLSRGRLHTLH